jgi:hypothetical protein
MKVDLLPPSEEAARLEDFVLKIRDRPERCVRFKEEALRQRLRTGHVDFLEIFCGSRGLTFAVSGEGLTVGEGLDMPSESYGKAWHLDRDEVWAQVRWMSAEGLRPRAIHSGLPCTKLSRIGYRDERDPDTVRYVELTIEVMEHQERQGLLGSVENPIGSLLWTMRRWKRFFGRGREPGVGVRTCGAMRRRTCACITSRVRGLMIRVSPCARVRFGSAISICRPSSFDAGAKAVLPFSRLASIAK